MSMKSPSTAAPAMAMTDAATKRVAILLILAAIALAIRPTPTAAQNAAEELDPAAMIGAFYTARAWVDEFTVPATDNPDARINIPGAHGINVVLRFQGRVLGTGTSAAGFDPDNPDKSLDLRFAVARALGQALGDTALQALPEPDRHSIGTKFAIEIEFAAEPSPLIGRSFEGFNRRLEPGVHGVALRYGDNWATRFPGRMRLRNRQGELVRELQGIAGELGFAGKPFRELTRDHGISAYRFETATLFQNNRDEAPVELTRGKRLVDPFDVSAQSIQDYAALWINRLRQQAEGGMQLRGDYEPTKDEYHPFVGEPRDQAFAAYALLHISTSPGLPVETTNAARSLGIQLLDRLSTIIEADGNVEFDPLANGMITLAASMLPEDAPEFEFRDELINRARAAIFPSWNTIHGFHRMVDAPVTPDGEPAFGESKTQQEMQAMLGVEQAIMCAAAATLADPVRHPISPDVLRQMLDLTWMRTEKARYSTLLPWIADAEIRWLRLAGPEGADQSRISSLEETAVALDRARITQRTPNARPDMWGAFDLGDRLTQSASGLPAAVFMAWRLRNFDFDNASLRARAFSDHLLTVRFLMELTVTEEESGMFRRPSAAAGGIQLSCWDSAQPVWVQAMGILVASETLRSIGD